MKSLPVENSLKREACPVPAKCVIIVGEMSKRLVSTAVLAVVLSGCSTITAQAPHVEPVYSFRPVLREVPDRIPVVGSSPAVGLIMTPQPSASEVVSKASPQPTVPPVRKSKSVAKHGRVVTGVASTYGPGYDGYFALPKPWGRGHRVTICNTKTHRCVKRTSNDTGPVERLHRVADLDVATFEYLCNCGWRKGVQTVTMTFHD